MIVGGGYSLWVFNRIAYGNLKTQYLSKFTDVNKREFFTLLPLLVCTLYIGVYPELLLMPMNASIMVLVEYIYC